MEKSFALILWLDTNESDVISVNKIKEKSGKTLAKWGSAWFPVKVIRKSEKKEWLDSLHITTDGKIVTPDKRSSYSPDLLLEKRNRKQAEKAREILKKNVTRERDENLLRQSSIFDQAGTSSAGVQSRKRISDLEEDDSEEDRALLLEKRKKKVDKTKDNLKNITRERDGNLLKQSSIFDELETSSVVPTPRNVCRRLDSDPDEDNSDKGKDADDNCNAIRGKTGTSSAVPKPRNLRRRLIDSDPEKDDSDKDETADDIHNTNDKDRLDCALVKNNNTNKNLQTNHDATAKRTADNTCICSEIPTVSKEDLQKLSVILTLAKSIHDIQNKKENLATKNTAEVLVKDSDITMTTKMELIRGSGIIVNAWKVRRIVNNYCKDAKEMSRKLMKLIVGEEVLKKCSVTGKNGWNAIPENIYEAVEQFVNQNVSKARYTITPQQFRQTITMMCATLRNSKTPAGKVDGKKSNSVSKVAQQSMLADKDQTGDSSNDSQKIESD